MLSLVKLETAHIMLTFLIAVRLHAKDIECVNHKKIIFIFSIIQGVPKTFNLEDDLGTFNKHSNKNERPCS